MSQSPGIKGGITEEAYQDKCFFWERGASVGVDINLFNFQDLLRAQEPIKHRGKGERKKTQNRSPLIEFHTGPLSMGKNEWDFNF